MHLTVINLTLLVAVVYAIIAVVYTKTNDNRLSFRNGSTTIDFDVSAEAYNPQGLRVYISHKPGLELLTFHGKIKTSNGEDGDHFAKDIIMNTNGQWVFEDKRRKLQVGDTLLFWIFMQYNGTGQRFNDLVYNVMYLTPGPINTLSTQTFQEESTAHLYSSRIPTTPRRTTQDTSSECACDKNTLSDMWAKMNRTSNKVLILEETISPLKERIKVLSETIEELVEVQNVGTNLLLTGNLPAQTNPVEDVRHLLIEKLNLRDLSNSIVQAKYIECGEIAFEVPSSIDKLRILKRSRDILSKLSYRIEDPNRREVDIDIRFSSDERCTSSYPLKKLPNPLGNLNGKVKIRSGVDPV